MRMLPYNIWICLDLDNAETIFSFVVLLQSQLRSQTKKPVSPYNILPKRMFVLKEGRIGIEVMQILHRSWGGKEDQVVIPLRGSFGFLGVHYKS